MKFIKPLMPEGHQFSCVKPTPDEAPNLRIRWCWLRFVLSLVVHQQIFVPRGEAREWRGFLVSTCFMRLRRLHLGGEHYSHIHDVFADPHIDVDGRRHTHTIVQSHVDPWTGTCSTPEEIAACWCTMERPDVVAKRAKIKAEIEAMRQ